MLTPRLNLLASSRMRCQCSCSDPARACTT
jgi:hypothetical protein